MQVSISSEPFLQFLRSISLSLRNPAACQTEGLLSSIVRCFPFFVKFSPAWVAFLSLACALHSSFLRNLHFRLEFWASSVSCSLILKRSFFVLLKASIVCMLCSCSGKNETREAGVLLSSAVLQHKGSVYGTSCSCRKRLIAFLCAPVGPSSRKPTSCCKKNQNLIFLACVLLEMVFSMFSEFIFVV